MANATKCYACDSEAAAREHVPPRCFFPADRRSSLDTVPSCPKHNNDQSKDVEYVRNVLVSFQQVNGVGLSLWEKARRSFERSPRLFNRTFRELWPVQTPVGETGVFRVDLSRLKEIMRGIARAVHYKNTGTTHSEGWEVFSPTMHSQRSLRGQADQWQAMRGLLGILPFTRMPTPVPEVFQCDVWRDDTGIVYRFTFYEGVVIYAHAKLVDPVVDDLLADGNPLS